MTAERILIVEDNPSHSKLEQMVLANSGYEIHVAVNADEAIKEVRSFKPRLILMDIQLPGMDGMVLTRKIKADPDYKDIIIVAITAYGMKGDKEMVLNAGANGYLSKPIDIEAFPEIISNYLKGAPVRDNND